MSLNDISLSPFVASSLYRSSLIADDSNEPIVKLPSEEAIQKKEPKKKSAKDAIVDDPIATGSIDKQWKHLGDNKKQILIVVDHSDVTHLQDEELGFLTAILSACKLGLGDVAIVNMNNYPGHSSKDFLDHFNSKIVLLFGMDPISFGLPVDFPQFQVQAFNNCTFLYSPPLEERNNDPLFKSKLWVCLKKIFGL